MKKSIRIAIIILVVIVLGIISFLVKDMFNKPAPSNDNNTFSAFKSIFREENGTGMTLKLTDKELIDTSHFEVNYYVIKSDELFALTDSGMYYELKMLDENNKEIDLSNTNMIVSIPYSTNQNRFEVLFLDETNGKFKVTETIDAYYENGQLVFTTNHLGTFLIRKTNNADEGDGKEYIDTIISNKKVLRSDLNITSDAKVVSSKVDKSAKISFINIFEPNYQFTTYYLFCFDSTGKLIFEVRGNGENLIVDKDNGGNGYKYNGKFDYDERNKILSFYTNIWLGEGEDSSGASFNGKSINDLTKNELDSLGNYSDEVKYEYKYDGGKMTFAKKTEISKLKNNEFYKQIFNK